MGSSIRGEGVESDGGMRGEVKGAHDVEHVALLVPAGTGKRAQLVPVPARGGVPTRKGPHKLSIAQSRTLPLACKGSKRGGSGQRSFVRCGVSGISLTWLSSTEISRWRLGRLSMIVRLCVLCDCDCARKLRGPTILPHTPHSTPLLTCANGHIPLCPLSPLSPFCQPSCQSPS